MFQYFILTMDCQSTNLFEITKEFGIFTKNGIDENDRSLQVI